MLHVTFVLRTLNTVATRDDVKVLQLITPHTITRSNTMTYYWKFLMINV